MDIKELNIFMAKLRRFAEIREKEYADGDVSLLALSIDLKEVRYAFPFGDGSVNVAWAKVENVTGIDLRKPHEPNKSWFKGFNQKMQ